MSATLPAPPIASHELPNWRTEVDSLLEDIHVRALGEAASYGDPDDLAAVAASEIAELALVAQTILRRAAPAEPVGSAATKDIDGLVHEIWAMAQGPQPISDAVASVARLLRAAQERDASGVPPGEWGGLSPKQAWWAGYRVGKGLPADMPRSEAVAAAPVVAPAEPPIEGFRRALEIIAAQHSGRIGSVGIVDCMATIARQALRAEPVEQPKGSTPISERQRQENENAAFHEWWTTSGQGAEPLHTLITENAAHATWQERARRALAEALHPSPALQARTLSDFIRNATPEEKEAVYLEVMDKATARQLETMAAPQEQRANGVPGTYKDVTEGQSNG